MPEIVYICIHGTPTRSAAGGGSHKRPARMGLDTVGGFII